MLSGPEPLRMHSEVLLACCFYVSVLGGGALRCIYKAMESSAKVEGGVE